MRCRRRLTSSGDATDGSPGCALIGVGGIAATWATVRLIAGPRAGALAAFALTACGPWYGSMFNHTKDIPFAAAMMGATFFLLRAVRALPSPRMRGLGRARTARSRKKVAPIMAAANGMSLVWLNIEPYHGPQAVNAKAARAPARGPAIRRTVAQVAAMPPTPISAHPGEPSVASPLDVSRRRQRTDRRLTLDPHPEVRDTPLVRPRGNLGVRSSYPRDNAQNR